MKERGILAAGTSRPRKNYPSEELKREKLSKRGEVVWLSWFNSLALRWKDRKDVYFLSTIHAPPDVPVWVGLDSSEDSGSEGERAQSQEVVQRREKVNGRWVTKKIYRPEIVKDYNTYMGGVDLCDQMTSLNKAKKQKRWYLRVFVFEDCYDCHLQCIHLGGSCYSTYSQRKAQKRSLEVSRRTVYTASWELSPDTQQSFCKQTAQKW